MEFILVWRRTHCQPSASCRSIPLMFLKSRCQVRDMLPCDLARRIHLSAWGTLPYYEGDGNGDRLEGSLQLICACLQFWICLWKSTHWIPFLSHQCLLQHKRWLAVWRLSCSHNSRNGPVTFYTYSPRYSFSQDPKRHIPGCRCVESCQPCCVESCILSKDCAMACPGTSSCYGLWRRCNQDESLWWSGEPLIPNLHILRYDASPGRVLKIWHKLFHQLWRMGFENRRGVDLRLWWFC